MSSSSKYCRPEIASFEFKDIPPILTHLKLKLCQG